MGNLFQKKVWRILSAVCACLLAIVLGFLPWATAYRSLVCSAIGGTTSKVVEAETGEEQDTEYFKDNGMSLDDWIEKEAELTREVQASGSVLLKNDGILPLQKGAKVSAFGYGTVKTVSTGLVRFGTPGQYIDFKTGMEEDGKLQLNPSLYEFYSDNASADPAFNTLNEIDVGLMTDAARADYDEYADAAIVVLSRAGGEAGDIATGDFTGGTKYLALQESEKKMLEEVTAHFDDVIVLINSSYAMELGWLEEYDIDACLMIGAIGYRGFNAVSDILTGATNPSGRLADTWAADSFSAPAMQNFGDYTFANAEAINEQIGTGNKATKYVVETEGIYVGYKYYETRYEDAVLGQGNASSAAGTFASASSWDYDEEVCFPFGYGLSYTQFTQELEGVRETEDTFEVTVKVTNSGSIPGRSVVQVYAQTPYTDFDKENGIEVASVELVGFDKTEELAANASEEVVISVDKEDLTHYDSFVNKTFIMEAGDYYLAVGDNAHDAVNNILAAKGKEVGGDAEQVYSYTLAQTDTQTYAVTDGNVMITNQFDDVDLNYYIDGAVTYLSRSDWNATWPEEMNDLSANAAMIEALDAEGNYEAGSADMSEYVIGADTDYTVAMMIGAGFDDPHWNDIINQMSIEDLVNLCARSGLNMIESISYPATFMKDGSHRVTDRSYVERPGTYAHIMPSVVIMAQSFDRELLYQIGLAFGEDNIRTATVGHYAPGVNIHRTPYSGRNFEYYSEDAFLSGEMSVPAIQGMQEKGAITYLKHFLGNEQETNRNGVSTFMSQQAMREVYLEAFKAGITEGKTKGIMGGFNRIGCTWTGAHYGLMTEVLRGEFEWTGIADTDAVFGYSPYMGFKCGLMAGTTMWATSGTGVYDAVIEDVLQDAQLVGKLREASHYLLYNVVNSLAFNGISQDSRVVPVTPYWEVILYVIIGVLSVVTVGSAAMVVVGTVRGGKKKEVNG
ncbi:MAG TPA: glycoside hydrolase family 3 C-terminal domain-containing protein [Candidatus Borkfalkia faecavium]|uniref:Glycoside hydrolase family 3 C-terminal domain-containing protein n=1 Tax=Candidatus Borkfalkia faecavium TaxID=2838508 RepID=A0A9D1VZS2_9FIRM|nr:glycoside hydrolase family 3 C-terminal domain-containing protein [Candidatus Borkfalkia faecavium]